MDIYLDTCSLNRLADEHTQLRIRQESEAVDRVLELVERGELRWAKSPLLGLELNRMSDELKKAKILPLIDFAQFDIPITDAAIAQAKRFEQQGLHGFDALHLAVCEHAGISVLLTVDDRFIRRAAKVSGNVSVENPVNWLRRTQAWQPSTR